MGEPKPLASLSGVLLARKGTARPAMRRPTMQGNGAAGVAQDDLGWNDMGYDVDPDPSTPMDYDHNPGYNPLAAAVPEAKPEVRVQQERIAAQLNDHAHDDYDGEAAEASKEEVFGEAEAFTAPAPAPVVAPVAVPVRRSAKVRAAPGSKEKAAFTLRLNSERHLKLRLACAVSNRSAQMLVTDALDAWLDSMPEIGQLAANVPGRNN